MLRFLPEHYQQSVCMKSRHFVQSQYAAAVVQNAAFFSNDLGDRLAMQILSFTSLWSCVFTPCLRQSRAASESGYCHDCLADSKSDSGLQLPEYTHHLTHTFWVHYSNKIVFLYMVPNLLKQVDFVLIYTT